MGGVELDPAQCPAGLPPHQRVRQDFFPGSHFRTRRPLPLPTSTVWQQEPPYQILIVGQRVNYRLPDGYGFPDGGWERDIWKMSRLGSVFQTNAEDYFVVSRALWERLWEKAAVPPFVLGGVAFDNWFTGKMNNMKDVIVVDGTRTVTCLHQNHDSSIKHSHTKPKSVYNTNLANSHGSWSRGTVTDCAFFTRRHVDGTLSLGERWPRMLYD